MGKKMKLHNLAKNTGTAYRAAKADVPKYESYRKEGRYCPKTNPPGHGGANLRGTPRHK